MFKQVDVPILGMVQNMSVFVCPHCHTPHHIFDPARDGPAAGEGAGSLTEQCQKHGIELLGDVPLNGAICRDADRGVPSVVGEPDGAGAKAFLDVARKVAGKIGL